MEYNQNTFLVIGAVCAVGITLFKMSESLSNDTPKKTKGGTRKNKSRRN